MLSMLADRLGQPCSQARLVRRHDVVYTPAAGTETQSQRNQAVGIGAPGEMVADDYVGPAAVLGDGLNSRHQTFAILAIAKRIAIQIRNVLIPRRLAVGTNQPAQFRREE